MINKAPIEDRIVIAPIMIPGRAMPRYHKEIGDFDICFSSEYIRKTYRSTDKSNIITTLNHKGKTIKCQVISLFIKGLDIHKQIQRELPFLDYQKVKYLASRLIDLPKGTWLQVSEFENSADLNSIIEAGYKGFSIELPHTVMVDGKKVDFIEEYERMDSNKNQLPFTIHINGGSNWSWGRSEHGEAHLELKKNGTAIDKIFIPSTKYWSSASPKIQINLLKSENDKISRKERKKIAEWLNVDNNLSRCQSTWNEKNKYNTNRVMFIY